jgi:hypothetical protein
MKSGQIRNILFTGLCMLFVQSNVISQDARINASAPSSVVLGQAFNYTISGDFSGDVELPSLNGIRLAGGPSTFVSQQSSFINGRMETTKTVTYTYLLIAQQEGDVVIPPAKVNSGRKTYQTNEVRIKVVKSVQDAAPVQDKNTVQSSPAGDESVFVKQIPSRSSVYVGEQFVLSTKIYTREALNIADFKAPQLDGFWRQDLAADQDAQQERLSGVVYLTQVFKRDLLTAQKSGIVTIDAASLQCNVRKKVSRSRSGGFSDPFFDDPFFDRYENVPQDFKTNAVTISVKPLPDGAPAGFNGAVGSFSFKAAADKTQLKVNDAITLRVHISGTGNLDLLKPVKIDFPPDLEVFDPKSVQKLDHRQDGTTGSIDYEYVLIPRHAGNFRISPVLFSWFDPSDEKYKTARSSEFTFTVDKSDAGDEAYISSPRNQNIANQGGKEVKSLAGDIRFIKITPPDLKPAGKLFFGSTLFIISFVLPLLILIALVVFRLERIRRNADMNAVRNRKARKLAEKRLKAASLKLKSEDNGFYDEILKAIWGYLSDKLGVSASELSRERISSELNSKNIDQDTLKSLWKILDDCEIARYASGSADKNMIYQDTFRMISVLQEKIN